ncbi:RusA family crossover junction endodeoxyribonuclease [Ligilactobacillus murinus]|uniref:RusA family crossover junction endodeoxyribonuclease n=1 Tax=Ligilactobacillus murinus TaxID=1622 RepID=UPI000E917109|nr:RusA family crossover junction endodeoxyribonuclease [Ligilactobacillus murinus]MBX9012641.1 RusA family crossover junction endodeoxyribonuclease [Ligilactobacillus murinus]HBV47761.1 RusA family crossover junction endodeoxyribonuclease [Lactobacillus sp.]
MILHIEPVEQARPRATRYGRSIRVYDPPKVSKYKKQLAQLARSQYKDEPLDGSLEVEISFYRPVQKSLSKIERSRRLSGEHRPTVKPDLDNYIKSTLDALNGILWTDDARIVDLHAHKYYSDDPHIEITVTEL